MVFLSDRNDLKRGFGDRCSSGPGRALSLDMMHDSVRSLRSIADAYDQWRLNPSSHDNLRSVQSAYQIWRTHQIRRIPAISALGSEANRIALRVIGDDLVVHNQSDEILITSIPLREISIETRSQPNQPHLIISHRGRIVASIGSDLSACNTIMKAKLDSIQRMSVSMPSDQAQMPSLLSCSDSITNTSRQWIAIGLTTALIATFALNYIYPTRSEAFS